MGHSFAIQTGGVTSWGNPKTFIYFTALVLLLPGAGVALAADDEQILEEVIVTGSAIKRKDLDGALPVDIYNAEEIARTGITNVAELIETIPAMQNYYTPADSVGGGGGGVRTANLRGIGSQYTLSLLNGRRMAPADSGSLIDLSGLPLAAIKQVEILKDGASALYGSDAISGVANFILKDSVEETSLSYRSDQPSESGGANQIFSLVTGFGNLEENGYSVVITLSGEEQDALASVDRDFAKTGLLSFRHGNRALYFGQTSANAIPANAYIYTRSIGIDDEGQAMLEEDKGRTFNPYRENNNDLCASQNTPVGEACGFDYTSTIEIIPEHERTSLFVNGKVNIADAVILFGTLLVSEHKLTSRIAPYPTGEFNLPLDSDLVRNEVLPHLTGVELDQTLLRNSDGTLYVNKKTGKNEAATRITASWRALPAGNRTTEYNTDSFNLTWGVNGTAGDIDYTFAVTHAQTTIAQDYPTGWLLEEEFVAASGSGAFNVFADSGSFSAADVAALAPTVYHGDWDESEVTMTALDAGLSMPVFDMRGGEAFLAVGVDYRETIYERSISAANRDEIILFVSMDTPYELERSQYGVYAEILFPVLDSLEVTASLRYDDIGSVEDNIRQLGNNDGDDETTYKVSVRYDAADWLALRGSYGTGFKAPSMREIGEPRSEFDVTADDFPCPFAADDDLAALCKGGETQYDVFREGYLALTFERSEQYTAGFVLTLPDDFDFTVDFWSISIEDQVTRLTAAQIFAGAETYRDLFTSKENSATGRDELAIIQAAVNATTQDSVGIDYALNKGIDFNWGYLDLGLNWTYMRKSTSSLTGSSLGRYGDDEKVVFKHQIVAEATLNHGSFTHNLRVTSRSGYDDQPQEVEVTGTLDDDDIPVPLGQGPMETIQLTIKQTYKVDYQLHYSLFEDSLALTFGLNNVFDEKPPLSLRSGDPGHQVGWDPRYADPFGRTYYLSAEYSF